jgi:hypothetical protein
MSNNRVNLTAGSAAARLMLYVVGVSVLVIFRTTVTHGGECQAPGLFSSASAKFIFQFG